jgi:hypothetical protein
VQVQVQMLLELLLQALCLLGPLRQVLEYLLLLLLLALRPAAVADAAQQASVLGLLQAPPC